MDVPRKDRRESRWNVRQPDHIPRVAKGEALHPGTLEAVVHAQEPDVVRRSTIPTGLRNDRPEALPNLALVGEAGESDVRPSHLHPKRPRTIEYPYQRMGRKPEVREPGSFVITGNQENGHPNLGDPAKGLESLERQGWWDAGAVEDVPAMDHDVHLAPESRGKRRFVARLEIVSPPSPQDAGLGRKVEPQMGVGEKENADGHGTEDQERGCEP
jgi:hypothetical protein